MIFRDSNVNNPFPNSFSFPPIFISLTPFQFTPPESYKRLDLSLISYSCPTNPILFSFDSPPESQPVRENGVLFADVLLCCCVAEDRCRCCCKPAIVATTVGQPAIVEDNSSITIYYHVQLKIICR